ncbi:WG repeat-containing protein [Psychrobacter sp. FDAARGOS_221]|uniref:WG repeat-containing protein n=1 Tax=Psychrobacter sp. FDAARGOS_221 TaxID=1975705 RepID=UPI000BB54CD0|nr:WG repeat-containing protein [Psychrobacter sp. FDAARGOS_221]PNK59819.1 hypothetical protein A6J60_002270 [Psychrobacter sp. FDAARGOS_221]
MRKLTSTALLISSMTLSSLSWGLACELPNNYEVTCLINGVAVVPDQYSDLKGLINYKGDIVIPTQYEEIGYPEEGLIAVKNNGRWGYINRSNETVIDYAYDEAQAFSDGLAAVAKDGMWGFIDKQGELVIPYGYSEVKEFSNGRASFKSGEKWGVIDKEGKQIVAAKYDSPIIFKSGIYNTDFAQVEQNERYGLINLDGEETIPVIYSRMNSYYTDGLIGAKKGHKWGFIDTDGKVKVDFKYDDVDYFSDGLAKVTIESGDYERLSGFIDKSGKEVIPPIYKQAGSFSEGLAPVWVNEKWGFINKAGEMVIPPKFEDVHPHSLHAGFSEGLISVAMNGHYGFINKAGETVIPFIYYNTIGVFENDQVYVMADNDYYYINKQGERVEPVYPEKTEEKVEESSEDSESPMSALMDKVKSLFEWALGLVKA